MTSRNDRKHRVQQYPIPIVRRAIADTVYGSENQRIFTDLFIGDLTYDEVAGSVPISTRGLQKRVHNMMPPFENYLRKLN